MSLWMQLITWMTTSIPTLKTLQRFPMVDTTFGMGLPRKPLMIGVLLMTISTWSNLLINSVTTSRSIGVTSLALWNINCIDFSELYDTRDNIPQKAHIDPLQMMLPSSKRVKLVLNLALVSYLSTLMAWLFFYGQMEKKVLDIGWDESRWYQKCSRHWCCSWTIFLVYSPWSIYSSACRYHSCWAFCLVKNSCALPSILGRWKRRFG